MVDVYDLTKHHSEWFEDNVHPSNDGARAIAELIAKKIK
jgi:lysophospholipase L1-like esterase